MPKYIYKHRRGTTTQWADHATMIPHEGEIVIELDEVNGLHKLKIGDGVHAYSELAYLMAGDEIVTQVLAETKPRIVTVELPLNWTHGDGDKYSQALTLDGVTEHSRLDLQPTADMLAEFKQLGLVFVTENNGGTITVYSVGNMPLKAYTMQATIIETECDGEDMPVVGIPVGSPAAQADWDQTEVTSPEFIKNKPTLGELAAKDEADKDDIPAEVAYINTEDNETIEEAKEPIIDVTAQVGQTIIVKEVDADGKPTKWEAADYQPRTHWSEPVEVLPETTCEVVEDIGAAILPDMEIAAGDTLIVVFNGTEYTCECADLAGNLAFGNWGAMQEEPTDTGEPFVAMHVMYGENTKVWIATALDGSTMFTLSVVKEKNHTIHEKYISSNMIDVPFYDLEADGFAALTYRVSSDYYFVSREFCSFAQKAHKRGGGVLRVSALISDGTQDPPNVCLENYSCQVHSDGNSSLLLCFGFKSTRCEIYLNLSSRTVTVKRYSFTHSEIVG